MRATSRAVLEVGIHVTSLVGRSPPNPSCSASRDPGERRNCEKSWPSGYWVRSREESGESSAWKDSSQSAREGYVWS